MLSKALAAISEWSRVLSNRLPISLFLFADFSLTRWRPSTSFVR